MTRFRPADRSLETLVGGVLLVMALAGLFSRLLGSRGIWRDDYPAAYLRIHEYHTEFRNGHFPQALPDVLRGGGSAFPRYYPPLTYYIGAGLYALVGNMVLAGNLTAFVSIVLSGLTAAWAARAFGVAGPIALLAGLAYAAFPYRFTNVLVRGALAESWALVWLPLVMVGAWQLLQGTGRSGRLFAVALAALLLTHAVSALWSVPLVVLTGALASPMKQWRQSLMPIVGWGAVGVGLAAWYLVPMRVYLPDAWVSNPGTMWATPSEFAGHGVRWGELIGLGITQEGPWPMRLSLGLQALVVPAALALLAIGPSVALRTGPRRLALACGLVWLGLLAVVRYPGAVSPYLPQPLLYLQFPWRLLGVAGLLGALAVAVALTNLPRQAPRSFMVGFWAILVAAGALAESRRSPSPVVLQSQLLARLGITDTGLTANYEYSPRQTDPTTLAERVDQADRALAITARDYHREAGTLRATFVLDSSETITFPLVGYDFLQALDGAGRVVPSDIESGLIRVRVGPGTQTIVIRRRIPPPVKTGCLISVLSALVLVGLPGTGTGTRCSTHRSAGPRSA